MRQPEGYEIMNKRDWILKLKKSQTVGERVESMFDREVNDTTIRSI